MKQQGSSTPGRKGRGARPQRATGGAGRPRTNEEWSEATRRKLLQAARRLFAARGYARASAEEIAQRAGLTRGALHYQFGDKRGLFEAVVRERCGALAERIARDTMQPGIDGPGELLRGCDVLLEAYGEPEIQNVLLRDAPVVLGWAGWLRVQEEAGLVALVRHALEHWAEAGWIDAQRVEPLSRLLFGALTQAGVAIGEAGDRAAALERYRREVRTLLESLAPAQRTREGGTA